MDGAAIVFTLLLLTFPTGRLASRRDWLILGPVMLALGPIELLWLVFFDLDGLNLLAFWPNEEVAGAIDWVQRVLLGGASTALVIVVVRRWLRASRPMRRTLLPVLAGAGALAVGTFTLLWDKIAGARTDFIGWLTALTLFALPIAAAGQPPARASRALGVGQLLVDLREDQEPAAPARRARPRAARPVALAGVLAAEYDAYEEGRPPVELPAGRGARRRPSSSATAEPVAALVHDPSLNDERELLDAVSAAAAIALENGRLQAELRAGWTSCAVRGPHPRGRRQRERQRLERDLHDGAQQRLVALSLALGLLEHRLGDDPDADALRPGEAGDRALPRRAARRSRAACTRPCSPPRPRRAALESLAARAPLPVALDVELGRATARAGRGRRLLRGLREHSPTSASTRGATSSTVEVERDGDTLVVEVVDDGVGGADTERRLRPARARRPGRGARRPAAGRGRRRARDAACERRSLARSRSPRTSVLLREGLARLLDEAGSRSSPAAATRRRAAARDASRAPDVAIARHPPAADAHRRGPAGGDRDPRAATRRSAVLVLSQYVELGLAMKLLADSRRGRRLPAQGPHQPTCRSSPSAIRRWRSGGSAIDPDDRVDAAVARAPRRPAGQAHPARARGARADGQGQLQPGHRRPARDHPARREVRVDHLRQARAAGHGTRAAPARSSPCSGTCAR